jgi:hypothetical protein
MRTGWNSLRLLTPEGKPFDLFAVPGAQNTAEGETPVCVDKGTADSNLTLRLVIHAPVHCFLREPPRRRRNQADALRQC